MIKINFKVYDLDLHCYIKPENVKINGLGKIAAYKQKRGWLRYSSNAEWLEIRDVIITDNDDKQHTFSKKNS